MDNQIFQAMLGTDMPADNSAESLSMANALRGQSDLGQFLSIAPGLETAGQDMQKNALGQAKQIGDRRQQGLTRTRQEMLDKRQREQDQLALEQQAYSRGQADDALTRDARIREEDIARGTTDAETAHQRALELAAQKDKEARDRAIITAEGKEALRTKMGTSEKGKYRVARTTAKRFPDLLAKVEASPDAFSASKDLTSYMPDWTPNSVLEGVEISQNKLLSDEQQRARNDVYNESYQIINTLAGAALAKNEEGRLKKFTPSPNDDARTVANKLRGLQQMANEYYEGFDVYSDYEPIDWMDVTADEEADVVVDDMAAGSQAEIDQLTAEIAAEEAALASVVAPTGRGPRGERTVPPTPQALPRATMIGRGSR